MGVYFTRRDAVIGGFWEDVHEALYERAKDVLREGDMSHPEAFGELRETVAGYVVDVFNLALDGLLLSVDVSACKNPLADLWTALREPDAPSYLAADVTRGTVDVTWGMYEACFAKLADMAGLSVCDGGFKHDDGLLAFVDDDVREAWKEGRG